MVAGPFGKKLEPHLSTSVDRSPSDHSGSTGPRSPHHLEMVRNDPTNRRRDVSRGLLGPHTGSHMAGGQLLGNFFDDLGVRLHN
jgi:hypothetical protein